jgi:hypothetical protein
MVETLVKAEKPAGVYQVIWEAGGLSTGVYFYRISTGGFSETNKMLLLR